MSWTGRAWIVAASVGSVEVLKDQGICRWNFVLRSLHQHAKSNIRSFSQAKMVSSSPSPAPAATAMRTTDKKIGVEKLKKSEESLREARYLRLSCWCPN